MNSKITSATLVALLVLAAIFMPSALAEQNGKHTKSNEANMVNDKIIIISGPVTKNFQSNGVNFTEDYYLIKKQNDPAEYPPIGIHLLKTENSRPKTIMGMLAGTGLTFNANYMTHDKSSLTLAEYLANNKSYLVVGIDARETVNPYDPATDYSFMAQLDLPQHAADVETAIKFAQKKTGIENYELTGHSLGLYVAADYAAKHSRDRHFKGVAAGIDMPGPLDPLAESELIKKEYDAYNASVQMLAAGQTIDFEMLGFAQMIYAAQNNPFGDSGMPNPFAPGTNFTNIEAVAVAMIYTNQAPGNEIFIQGFLAGDINGPYYTPLSTMLEAGTQGTIYPIAINRDVAGIYANVPGSYQIQWQNIKIPFEWWNMEVGIGNRPQAVSLMRQAGNINANFHLKSGYGHADPVYATSALQDLWQEIYI